RVPAVLPRPSAQGRGHAHSRTRNRADRPAAGFPLATVPGANAPARLVESRVCCDVSASWHPPLCQQRFRDSAHLMATVLHMRNKERRKLSPWLSVEGRPELLLE